MRVRVHIIPGSSREMVEKQVDFFGDDIYRVYVTSRPVDGAANTSLINVIADYFDVKRRHVRIVSGFTSRMKILEIEK